MTEGLPDASSKLRLVLDYLPCEACLSQPVADQELLCTLCHRLHREVDVTLVRRATVLVERPTPVAAPIILPPPAPLPPPEEVVVPAPAPDAFPDAVPEPAPAQEPIAAAPEDVVPPSEPAPYREEPAYAERVSVAPAEPAYAAPEEPAPAPEPEPTRAYESFAEPATPPPAEEVPAVVEEAPMQAEAAPEPAPAPAPAEPAKETRRSRGFASLFRRKKAEEPAAAPAPGDEPGPAPAQAKRAEEDEEAEEHGFDDVATYTGPRGVRASAEEDEAPSFDDSFEYVSDRNAAGDRLPETFEYSPPAQRAAEKPAPVDELEDDFLYRPPGERRDDGRPPPLRLPPEEPPEPPEDLMPREEVPVEPAEPGRNPWAPAAEQDPFEDLLEPRRDPEPEPERARRAEPAFEWSEEVLPEPARGPAPEPDEEIIETEIVEMEIVEDDEPILETQVVDEEPPAPAPASAREPDGWVVESRSQSTSEAREVPYDSIRFEEPPPREEARAQAPAPLPPPEPRAAPEDERKSRFASLFKRRKDKPQPAPAAAPPAPAPVPAPAAPGGARLLTLRCGDCGTVFDLSDTGDRPLVHVCPGCGAEGVLRDAPPVPAPAPGPDAFAPPPAARHEDVIPSLSEEAGPEEVIPVPGPAPGPVPVEAHASDLYRLPAFNVAHAQTLQRHRIEAISHLSGHDPHELSQRTAIDAGLVASWVNVADLVQEVGVPLDKALTLVAAGVDGPRGLRALDAEAILDRVALHGDEGALTIGDVRRWKRRA